MPAAQTSMARKRPLRTKIAAGGTLAGLGVLAAVATASNSGEPSRPPETAAAPAQVRTVVVHRTVGVRTAVAAAARQARPARPASSRQPVAATAQASVEAAPSPAKAEKPGRVAAALPGSGQGEAAEAVIPSIPAPGVTEDECAPVSPDTVAEAAARPLTAVRKHRRRGHAQRRGKGKAATPSVDTRPVPARTRHPLPEDVQGAVIDGCGPPAADPAAAAASPTTANPATATSAMAAAPEQVTP